MLDVVMRLESTGMDERPTVKLHQLSEGSGMETQLENLPNEALTLTASERAALAQLLLESLEEDSELDDLWAVEVDEPGHSHGRCSCSGTRKVEMRLLIGAK
jgi:hypothetical protein